MSSLSEHPAVKILTLLLALYGACLSTCNGCGQKQLRDEQRAQTIADLHGQLRALLEVGEGTGPQGFTEDSAKIRDAEKVLQQLLIATPDDPRALLYRGHVGLARGDLNEALDAYRKVVEIDPRFAQGHMYLGLAHLARDEPAAAETSLEVAAGLEPENPVILINLGTAQVANWNLTEAQRTLTTARTHDPTDASIHAALGNLYATEGRLTLAVDEYRRAIRYDPRDSRLFRNLGSIQFALGDLDKSATAYQQAIQLDPNDVSARSLLAQVLRARGKAAEADASSSNARALEQLLTASPPDPLENLVTGADSANVPSQDPPPGASTPEAGGQR